jgi:competence protein ComEA
LRVYTGKLNINTASSADLTRLPGVGEVIAYRIVKEREKKGIFRDSRELQRVKGISERVFAGFKGYVDTKGDNTLKVYLDLNTATKSLLQGVPGGTAGEARSILNYRKSRGRFTRIDELRSVPGIDSKRYGELVEHLTVARQ